MAEDQMDLLTDTQNALLLAAMGHLKAYKQACRDQDRALLRGELSTVIECDAEVALTREAYTVAYGEYQAELEA